jgi:hypothetical protein
MYSAFTWLSTNCRQSAITFKVDSDVIINVVEFVKYSKKLIKSQSFEGKIFGFVWRNVRPNRQTQDKWFGI